MTGEEERREPLPRVAYVTEFYYNPETQMFTVGEGEKVVTTKLDHVEDVFAFLEGADFTDEVTDFADHTMGLGFTGAIVEYPSMRRWIADLDDRRGREVKDIVIDEMVKVWGLLNQGLGLQERPKGKTHMDFRVSLFPDGTFIINTFGNCACLGRTPDGVMGISVPRGSEDIESPMGNTLHNADTPVQRLSLFVGAGTLAWLARHQ
ncbi:hypothetical protein A3D80_03625 [Candidatus Roizmanbacteria bacterium RIFCSPHIGHO2_02_FULL_40_13b]|uniref:Uncharacterized protein n=1 Tax=Candidatus Roizmanbacteria bacterium RIFCSPHIGHO2_01_FULL_39_24 TaxID=1802032 RepID=A0A1F7GJD0_9BACT|nr:MAG: hypothetical protein A2799_04185 [Candidatus Roizmanbacteria bacterium RIFCSPHIGHO2_01_FULL_39_24]OGK27054.1 MAG: hypothetical protein A3D80_03625 [Candidatus Roizmanbacteria bacterium RIFCSPHIGHO2_02_FULL_40_13b]OGK48790.1 MAG: hypothetical protein A3A56_01095 [Candidatus Roizmanbacteria bacterium RIFCSPLOWO2_01_FULL_40_32]OGK56844.1 MAG: hypothetical protein A3H83_01245 [Candidatus Roizmanbacteria bacterium RIFCSPLOWO2_02_FULL_39_8]